MRISLVMVALTASLAMIAPASFAQPRNDRPCAPGQRNCTQPAPSGHSASRSGPQNPPRATEARRPAPQAQRAQHREAPRIGHSARGGQPFQRAPDSRFNAPPRGQEYRVVNDHLVLVDSRTLKIVSIIGLLSALTR